MMKYHDIETDEILTYEQLCAEFEEYKQSRPWEVEDCETVSDFIDNRLTRHNGTLDIIYT